MNLGENIYKFRAQKNMSQGDLADALDVSRQSVSKWENNNAVPELDKLIRMSEIFGITLDELVSKPMQEQSSIPEPTPPVQQVIIKTQFRPVTMRQILGVLFICAGLLFLPFALSATHYRAMGTCLILCGLLAACGISVLMFRYAALPCGWLLLTAFSLYVFMLTHWETAYPALALIGLCLIIMILWTIRAHKSGLFPIPAWLWWVGSIVLAGLLILFCMNFVEPFWIGSTSHTASPG